MIGSITVHGHYNKYNLYKRYVYKIKQVLNHIISILNSYLKINLIYPLHKSMCIHIHL